MGKDKGRQELAVGDKDQQQKAILGAKALSADAVPRPGRSGTDADARDEDRKFHDVGIRNGVPEPEAEFRSAGIERYVRAMARSSSQWLTR